MIFNLKYIRLNWQVRRRGYIDTENAVDNGNGNDKGHEKEQRKQMEKGKGAANGE